MQAEGQAGGPGVVTLGRPLKQRLLIYFTRLVNSIGPPADGRVARARFVIARRRRNKEEGRKKGKGEVKKEAGKKGDGYSSRGRRVVQQRGWGTKKGTLVRKGRDESGRYIVARVFTRSPRL